MQVFQDDFDIRHAVLATFRNKVLNRVLPSIDFRIPLLYRSMIFSILILTDDNSQEFIIFKKIGGSILAYEHGEYSFLLLSILLYYVQSCCSKEKTDHVSRATFFTIIEII